jgi:hypothetical protein
MIKKVKTLITQITRCFCRHFPNIYCNIPFQLQAQLATIHDVSPATSCLHSASLISYTLNQFELLHLLQYPNNSTLTVQIKKFSFCNNLQSFLLSHEFQFSPAHITENL